VQGRELVGAQARIAQVVPVLGDAVAVHHGEDAGDVLHLERHAHGPQVVLVALERAPEGVGLVGVHPQPIADLERGQWARGLEQQRREVQ
jgi:hypothetical protein